MSKNENAEAKDREAPAEEQAQDHSTVDESAQADRELKASVERSRGEDVRADSHHNPNHMALAPEAREQLQVRDGWAENATPAVLRDRRGVITAQTNPELDVPALDGDPLKAVEADKRDARRRSF